MVFEQKIKKTFNEPEVNVDKYLDLAITDAFSILREAVQNRNLADGLAAVQLSAYQVEVLAKARKIIGDDDEDYKQQVADAYSRLVKNDDDFKGKTNLAYFKIGYILSRIEDSKPLKEIGKI